METKEWYEKQWLDTAFINGLPLMERKAVIIGEGTKEEVGSGEKKYPRIKLPVSFTGEIVKEWTVSMACHETLRKEFGTDTKKWVGAILLFYVDHDYIRVTVLGKDGKEVIDRGIN